eukprot:gene37839-46691_t
MRCGVGCRAGHEDARPGNRSVAIAVAARNRQGRGASDRALGAGSRKADRCGCGNMGFNLRSRHATRLRHRDARCACGGAAHHGGGLEALARKQGQHLFDVSLGCMALGIALNQLRQQGQNNALLSPGLQRRLFATVRETGRLVAGRRDIGVDHVLDS